ncbi:MAG: YdcF family protein [Acidimicrobiia bacterium]|nr:YdcF family protein [Acidimicrobiia bacterium]
MATMLGRKSDARHARPEAGTAGLRGNGQGEKREPGMGRHRKNRPWRRRLRRVSIAVVAVVFALASAPAIWIVVGTRSARYTLADVPPRSTAIVLGAGLRPGNRPSPYLERRLDAAAHLYREGKVERILVSGDTSDFHDEAGVMRRHLIEKGVPAHDIVLDSAGRDTYDSCWRARHVYGVEEAVVVTQEYHLPRAVYTCREVGIDTVGVGASGEMSNPLTRLAYMAREIPADHQALWEVHVSKPTPRDVERSAQD